MWFHIQAYSFSLQAFPRQLKMYIYMDKNEAWELQYPLMTDHGLVKDCMHRILKKLGVENPDTAVQRQLEYLCDQVHEKTGVLLSLSTAKRLLNGQFSKLPQPATLNAIAQFLDYRDWQHYRQAQSTSEIEFKDISKQDSSAQSEPKRGYKRITGIVAIGVMAVTFVLIGFLNRDSAKNIHAEKALFRVKRTTLTDIPNTVVFHYNVDDIEADSFFIQQSWDKSRRVRIHKKQYTLTDIYYEPGYHVAKLIANDKVIKTFDVSIPTNKWFYYTKEKGSAGIFRYIEKYGNKDTLGITRDDLKKNEIDTTSEKNYIAAYFPDRYEISSDDFVFKARVRRLPVRNDFCPMLMPEIFCQRNFIFLQSMKPGCSSNAMAQFGENFLDGKTNDLSALATNVDEWHDYEISIKDKMATVYIDNKKVFERKYRESSGMITGLGFISNGLCEVNSVELKGGNGKVFYSYKAK